MARRNSILGFIVALSLIAFVAYSVRPVGGTWFESFAEFYFWILVAIIAISIGGAITRSGKAGAVVGFLAVWIPFFALLILLLALGESDAGFAVIVATSFLLGALGAFIGGNAGYLSAMFLLWWGAEPVTRKSRRSTIKEYLALMLMGGRYWKLWQIVALVLLVLLVAFLVVVLGP